MTTSRSLVVPPSSAGERIDKFVAEAIPELSRSVIARLIKSGDVRLNGLLCSASRRVQAGDAVTMVVPPPIPSSLSPESIPLTILYEDADIIVVDKPAGLVVHPGAGVHGGTLANALLAHCGESLRGVGGEIRPGIVHRLDRGTSGAIVVAKTQAAHQSLSAQFARRTVQKQYLAVVRGVADETGRVDAPIGRSTTTRTRMAVGPSRARAALTEWTLREVFGRSASLVEVRLHTGRTHQVRVHLTHAGLPLVGDATYGSTEARAPNPRARPILAAFGRPALHAWRLAFEHPTTGAWMAFEAPIPPDILALLDALRVAVAPLDGT